MKPYYANVYQAKLTDPISAVNWHKTAVVSQKPTFHVDIMCDAKLTCDADVYKLLQELTAQVIKWLI